MSLVEQTPAPQIAPDSLVGAALTAATENTEYRDSNLRIHGRTPISWGSSHFIEVLDCKGEDREHQILCKYGHHYARGGSEHVEGSYGHRKGVEQEADVYQHLLSGSGLTSPRYYGSHSDTDGRTWLFIEHLDGALRVSKSTPYIDGLVSAARWIAEFHREFEEIRPSILTPFDAEYFTGWGSRTVALMDEVAIAPPWLKTLAATAGTWAPLLAEGPLTAIHGEYYMHNILHYEGAVYPIDWETAALAVGEIDLATLTEDVEPDVAAACIAAYRSTRWPGSEPPDFGRRLGLARMYLHLRWLGEDAKPTARQHEWRLPLLHQEALGLGLVSP